MAYRMHFTQVPHPLPSSGFNLMAEHVSAPLSKLAGTSTPQQLRYKAGGMQVLSSRLEVEAGRGCGAKDLSAAPPTRYTLQLITQHLAL